MTEGIKGRGPTRTPRTGLRSPPRRSGSSCGKCFAPTARLVSWPSLCPQTGSAASLSFVRNALLPYLCTRHSHRPLRWEELERQARISLSTQCMRHVRLDSLGSHRSDPCLPPAVRIRPEGAALAPPHLCKVGKSMAKHKEKWLRHPWELGRRGVA